VNFDWSEDQLLFRDTVERFLADRTIAARRAQQSADGGIDRARWREMAALGLTALPRPEEAGGLGGAVFDLVAVADMFGQRLSADQWLDNAALPGLLLGLADNPPGWTGEVAEGTRVLAVAFAEPDRRHALEPRMEANAADGGLVLQGSKTLVLGGMAADTLLVTALLEGGPALLACPAGAKGVERRGYRLVDGSLAAEIAFRGVRLQREAILTRDRGRTGRAFDLAALLAAAELAGLGDRMLADTLDYVRQREQFGQPIGGFQALQHRLVDAYALADQSRSMLYRAAMHLNAGGGDGAHGIVAGAKALIAGNTLKIGREAIQLHGGMGTTEEMGVGHGHKRSLLLAQLLGDPRAGLARYAELAA
jgi:alkylation response protein AidB-like acyl-CoA dehydrogenase